MKYIDKRNILKFICIMIIYFVSEVIILPFFDLNNLTTKDEGTITLLSSIINAIILFFIYRKDIIKDFNNFKKNYKNILFTAIKFWIIGYLSLTLSSSIIMKIINYIGNNQTSLESMISANKLYMVISVAIFTPFVEELIFRKSIRDFCKKDLLFIIISGLIFGYMHVMTETVLINYLLLIPYALFGSIFAKAYVETDNIFTSIFMHMLHNSFALLILFLA